jgi:hypothetical protein
MSSPVLIVDSLSTLNPAVTVRAASGRLVPCATVTLTPRQGVVATTAGPAVTGRRTGQSFVVASTLENSSARDSALLIVANIASPVAYARVPRFDLLPDTIFELPIIVDMRGSGEKLGAATIQVAWDPGVLTYMSDADAGNAVNATVNASGVASGSLTLALASSSGFSGAVEVRRLTFKASSAAGRSGALSVTAIDIATAGTFANLAQKTVGSSFPLRTR